MIFTIITMASGGLNPAIVINSYLALVGPESMIQIVHRLPKLITPRYITIFPLETFIDYGELVEKLPFNLNA